MLTIGSNGGGVGESYEFYQRTMKAWLANAREKNK